MLHVFHFKAQRPRGELKALPDIDHCLQSGALARYRVLSPHGDHVQLKAVEAGYHGETRQAAFGHFRLHDEGNASPG